MEHRRTLDTSGQTPTRLVGNWPASDRTAAAPLGYRTRLEALASPFAARPNGKSDAQELVDLIVVDHPVLGVLDTDVAHVLEGVEAAILLGVAVPALEPPHEAHGTGDATFGSTTAMAETVLTSALGVLGGSLVGEYVNPKLVRWFAGLGFIAVGMRVLVASD